MTAQEIIEWAINRQFPGEYEINWPDGDNIIDFVIGDMS